MEDVYTDNNPEDTEKLIKKLKHIPLETIGCPEWLTQRGIIEELNLQSSFCILQHQEEYVKELILSNNKMKHLIYELIHTEYWIDNVYKIIHSILTPNNTIFSLYMVLYYETTLTNLLQVLMFHSEAVTQSTDYIIDIIDFVGRKLNWMIGIQDHEHEMYEEDKFGDNEFDMKKHHFRIQFGTCIKSVSLLRYIVEQMGNLSMGVRAHILNTHDMAMTVTEVLLRKSWYRTDSKGEKYAFIENNWMKVSDLQDPDRMSKTDGQLWVCLYRLLLDKENQSVYEITAQRKASLFRLQTLLSDPKLDQMSLVEDIRKYLDNLRMFNPRNATLTNYVIEKHAVIRNRLIEKYPERGFKSLARKSLEDYFSPNGEELIEQAKSLSSHFDILATYTEATESVLGKKPKGAASSSSTASSNTTATGATVITDGAATTAATTTTTADASSCTTAPARLEAPHCKKCKGPGATKRCSTCKQAWYCRRQCQVDDWQVHKHHCRPATEQQAVDNCRAGFGEPGSMALKRSPPRREKSFAC